MVRRDYTQEIGVHAPEKLVAWPYVVVVLAAAAVVGWIGVVTLPSSTPALPDARAHASIVKQ
jgi:hypothetical protein